MGQEVSLLVGQQSFTLGQQSFTLHTTASVQKKGDCGVRYDSPTVCQVRQDIQQIGTRLSWSKCHRKDGTSLMHVCACACMCADGHAYILTKKIV